MVKNSALTLPVLAVLVLIGAGVVFIGPQLTGWQIVTDTPVLSSDGFELDNNPSHLYPAFVGDYDNIARPQFAFGDNDPNYAILGFGFRPVNGVSRCPSGFTFVDWMSDIRSPTGYCRLGNRISTGFSKLSTGFALWLSSTSHFKPATGSLVSNPINIYAVEVGASDVPRTLYEQPIHSSYRVFVRAKCTAGSGAYIDKYLGKCDPLGASSVTCKKVIGTTGCSSGKWTVNRVVVGNAQYDAREAIERRFYATNVHIHWIRLLVNAPIMSK